MSENESGLVSLNALVVDDSRVMRNMVMQTLQQARLANFTFEEAGSGNEALGKFDADTIDIIFVDWNMPGMNGIEFAREIRAMSWAQHIPIVMITSETGQEKQQNAYDKARITCYVTKPFTVEEIRFQVSQVIQDLLKKRNKTAASAPADAKPAAPAAKQGGFFSKLLS